MSATYTYDPNELTQKSVSRARFELGDVMVSGEGQTCMLCDEEIRAVIEGEKRWKRAMYKLADAVCMRLSYETNWRDDGTAFDRTKTERWMAEGQVQRGSHRRMHADLGAVNDSISQRRRPLFPWRMVQSPMCNHLTHTREAGVNLKTRTNRMMKRSNSRNSRPASTGTNVTGRERPQELVLHGDTHATFSVVTPRNKSALDRPLLVTHTISKRRTNRRKG